MAQYRGSKNKCLTHGPKETVEHLSLAVGGVVSASAPGELPRNKKQVTNLRQQTKLKGHPCGPNGEIDDLFVVMQRGYSEDPGSKFIRSIRAAPDPAIVLAEDHQITLCARKPSQPIMTRVEMNASSDTPVDSAVPPAVI